MASKSSDGTKLHFVNGKENAAAAAGRIYIPIRQGEEESNNVLIPNYPIWQSQNPDGEKSELQLDHCLSLTLSTRQRAYYVKLQGRVLRHFLSLATQKKEQRAAEGSKEIAGQSSR